MIMFKAYNNLKIEQLAVYLVKFRHKDKVARCRFFVVPGYGLAFLGMHDIELLGILMIMCNVIGNQQAGRSLTP